MDQTAVEWYAEKSGELELKRTQGDISLHELVIELSNILKQAKEMEKNDTDNKAIHFGEWLTNKHTGVLITLYERFEEEHYKSE